MVAVNTVLAVTGCFDNAEDGAYLMNAACAVLSLTVFIALLSHKKNVADNKEDAE